MPPPRATYRLQLRPGFGLREAAALTGQLARLGVSHLYLSPCLQAVPGSAHGYDVIDHRRVREDLGGEAGFAALVDAARSQGLGILLDIVPNHMAIDPGNRWWWDVLENGRSSLYALYFDVSWDPPERKLKDLILVPILADHYGRELERGAIRLERTEDRVLLRYQERDLPLSPSSLDQVFARVAERAPSREAALVARDAAALPDLDSPLDAERLARHQAKEALAARIAALCGDPDVAPVIDREIARINGDPDDLDALLRRQHYRVAYWRTAARELDYRRFFDINDLVALRVEESEVFDAVHERVLGWLRDGAIDGVRVDHVDGLRDPGGYLRRLRAEAGDGAWILVEKILHHDERIRASWPVDGTTGYETIDLLTRVFIDPRGIAPLTDTYRGFTGEGRAFVDVAIEAKREVMRDGLAADVDRVTALLVMACERDRRQRDHTREVLRDAVRELAAATAVYRTYTSAERGEVEEEDRRWLDGAVGTVRRRRPDIDPELLRSIRALVLLEVRGEVESEFAMRFQQLTAPVMAMGIEDTAFYRYARLVALNEVGSDPARTDAVVAELHRAARERLARWPRSLVAASTHDTKRSADVRARIGLLAEIHLEWAEAVARWSRHNDRHRTAGMPDREMEYLYYQTLVGAHPLPLDRALAYMEKAAREAGRGTSWTAPNERYERALADFVRGTLGDPVFTADLDSFVAPLVRPGRVTSLAQTLLRLTLPGVPDVYQGDELWDLSLVDPDSRRPVDHELRGRLLDDLDGMPVAEILARMDEGLPKLHVIRRSLAVRAERPDAFASGSHDPLAPEGARAAHVVAYARGGEVAVVVPRLVVALAGDWRDTTVALPDGRWCDRLTGAPRAGGVRRVAELLDAFPVALLTRE
ncbi:MAG: malto-oligosyltrehalose synthase [Chloroflexota bacterium]|nr:malto-oligosyltrehalose synthase [Chloroflexota bacterium]